MVKSLADSGDPNPERRSLLEAEIFRDVNLEITFDGDDLRKGSVFVVYLERVNTERRLASRGKIIIGRWHLQHSNHGQPQRLGPLS